MDGLKEDIIGVSTEQLFDKLGLLCSKYQFDDIIQKKEIRDEIKEFNTDLSKILILSPNYFVMPGELRGTTEEKIEKVKLQTFFVKIIKDGYLSKNEAEIYKKYYGENNIVIMNLDFVKKKILISKLSNLTKKIKDERVLLKFLDEESYKFFLSINLNVTNEEIKQFMIDYKRLIFD